ncbi:hypothetical protein PspLS_00019 [Pyricularia sp. CBS 133598]|nr:hypothetical protein PspLS_00019 [Pyricularia sp. CBS 133598]
MASVERMNIIGSALNSARRLRRGWDGSSPVPVAGWMLPQAQREGFRLVWSRGRWTGLEDGMAVVEVVCYIPQGNNRVEWVKWGGG